MSNVVNVFTTAWDVLKVGVPGFAIAAAAYLVYVAVKQGVPAAWAKVKSWWGSAAALEARVVALEQHVFGKSPGPTGTTGVTGPSK